MGIFSKIFGKSSRDVNDYDWLSWVRALDSEWRAVDHALKHPILEVSFSAVACQEAPWGWLTFILRARIQSQKGAGDYYAYNGMVCLLGGDTIQSAVERLEFLDGQLLKADDWSTERFFTKDHFPTMDDLINRVKNCAAVTKLEATPLTKYLGENMKKWLVNAPTIGGKPLF